VTTLSPAIAGYPAIERPATIRLRRERRFFTGMAIAMALVCFAGFAPSYYLKAQFGTPTALKPMIHFHGLVFTAWMVLMVVQSSLISAGRVQLHRRLGIAGAVLVLLMVASGAGVIWGRATTVTPGIPHEMILGFMAIATVALALFPIFIGAALLLRRNAAAHKRLMLLATTIFLSAAVHRLLMFLIDPAVSPPVFFGATDLFIVALAGYDFLSRGRIHAATLWGGLAVVLSQAGSLVLAGSSAWMTFAHWITGM
jgi:hypothetical protein